MNSPSSFSSSNDPEDLADLIGESDTSPQREREGLPAGFRMRANAHYVDQLETPPRPALRMIAVSTIETESPREAPDSLVSSVRKHGVLEPLLVQHDPRGRQYRLIAGRMRLAAARAAGLREVPCVVHAISDAEAAELMEATHDARHRQAAPSLTAPDHGASLYPAQRELEAALNTIESCTSLLNQPSALARRGAAQVIAGECRRAHRVLKAMTVLGNGIPLRRVLVRPLDLFTRLHETFRDEQRLRGLEPAVHVSADAQLALYGDDDLLLTALGSVVNALTAAAGDRARDVAFVATANATSGTLSLEVIDRSLILSEQLTRAAFTAPWPVPDGDAVLVLLQAARWIVAAHGGSITLTGDATRTTVRLQLPSDQTSKAGDRTAN